MMLRIALFAVMIGAIAAPALAKGGASDEAHARWAEQQKKYKEAGQRPPNLFDLLFGDEKKKSKKSK